MQNKLTTAQINELATEIAKKFHEEAVPVLSTAELNFIMNLNYMIKMFFGEEKAYSDSIKLTYIKDMVKQLDIEHLVEFKEENNASNN